MRIMTRVGTEVMRLLARGAPFVKCMHSVGVPLQDGETSAVWPCNPENVMIAHKPDTMEILRWDYKRGCVAKEKEQCSGFGTFWYGSGSGSAEPYL
jgi:phosphoenolpyruvate carboxykinase (GTP)